MPVDPKGQVGLALAPPPTRVYVAVVAASIGDIAPER